LTYFAQKSAPWLAAPLVLYSFALTTNRKEHGPMPYRYWYPLLAVAVWALVSPPAWGGVKEFTLTDHLRRDWKDEPVHFPIEFVAGDCDGRHLQLTQQWNGRRVVVQLTDIQRHADGSVRKALVTFVADMPARQSRTWRLEWGAQITSAPGPTPLTVQRQGEAVVLCSGPIAVRVPAEGRRFPQPVPAVSVPAPLAGVRGPDGQWRGKGWLESPLPVESYETRFDEEGPVVRVYRIVYRFAGGKSYQVRLRLYSGLNYVHVLEDADVDKASRFVFSAHAGFAPTHWVRATMAPEPLGYQENRRLMRFFFNTYFHQIFDLQDWLGLYRDAADCRDYLGFVKVNGGDWTSPLHNAIHVLQRSDPDLRLEGTLRPCRREWLVAMFDRTQFKTLKEEYFHGGPLTLLCARVGFAPLDEIKDLTLDWPLRRQPRAVTPAEKEVARELVADLDNLAKSWPVNGPYGSNYALNYRDKKLWRLYPMVAGTGALAEDDERYVRAALALIAYAGMQRDFFAWYFPLLPREDTRDAEEPLENWRYHFYMMNTNFDSCRFTGIAEIALSIRDHPDFDKFLDHYKQCLRLHLDNTFSEDGYYHESVSYMCWNLFVLTATMDRVKRELGLDSFDEPRYRKGLWAMLNLATPPDPRDGGARTLPPFGDHDPRLGAFETFQVDSKGVLALAADAYAPRDPELAGALAWLWQQVRAKGAPPTAAPKAPTLGHQRIRGWGAVLRWEFGAPHESYLAFRCDPFVGRYINIENSFQLHARGQPLILTPNSGGFVGGEPFGSRAQNKISFGGDSNYEHFWGQLGELEDFQTLGTVAYVRGFVAGDAYQRRGMNWDQSYRDKPHAHRRHLLGVGGDYYVLADEVQCAYSSDLLLHVLADRVERQNQVLRFTGRYDVDLDVHLLAPANAQVQTTPTRMANQAEPKSPLSIVTLQSTAPPNQPFLTVLVPLTRGTAAPQIEQLDTAFGFRVMGAARLDHVFLSPGRIQWRAGGLRFEGTRGILRVKPQVELTLLDAGRISDGRVTVHSDAGGVTLAARAEGGWSGLTDGPAKTVSLEGARVKELQLDDRPYPWKATPTGATVLLPAGSHRLRLR
jgi:hypothetical protein